MENLYFRLTGPAVKGESERDGFKEDIEIQSFSWGVGNSGTTHSGGGSSGGTPHVADISLSLNEGKASPKLMMHSLIGTHFDKAELFFLKTTGENKHAIYRTITLRDMIITSYSTGGSAGGGMNHESMSLNFAKFTDDYKAQDAKGVLKAVGAETFDIKKGVKES